MEFRRPNPEQLHAGVRALKTIAEADGPCNAAELGLLRAALRAFGGDFDLDALAPITPAELARAVEDRQIRWQLVGAMVVMTLADGDVDRPEVEQVRRFAQALEVEDPAIANLGRVAAGHLRLARLDILRRQWAVRKLRAIAQEEGPGTYWKALLGLLRIDDDPALAARYQAMERCPPGSLGRAYFDYLAENGFPFPGQKGAAPEVIVFHDMTHILSGYGTTPAEEILVVSFSAGYSRVEHLNWFMFVLLQFQAGIQTAPGVEPTYDMLDPDGMLEAIQRGAAMNLDLNDGWSYWDVLDEPVDELRRRYNIPPRQRPPGPRPGSAA